MNPLFCMVLSFGMALMMCGHAIGEESPKPIWSLSQKALDAATVTGTVELKNGSVRIDGSNALALPADLIGKKTEYTIEFEITRSVNASMDHDTDRYYILSNMDEKNKAGLAIGPVYAPPSWTSTLLRINGYPTITQKTLKPGTTYKITLLAQDRHLMLFIDGLLLGMTGVVNPSDIPLQFGQVVADPVYPYELKNIAIYESAVFPGSYDPSVKVMRTYSGDQYTMQRAEITDPSLPRILVIGDSISMGYRQYITDHFKGKAYVDYWITPLMFTLLPGNLAGDDAPIKRAWKGVLSNGPYDVVSLNPATLHMWDPGKPERCPVDDFDKTMTDFASIPVELAPKTKFLWVRCTPISKKVEGGANVIDQPKNDRIAMLNQMTDPVMQKLGMTTVNLYEVGINHLDLALHDGIHWNADAYKLMAAEIIKAIETELSGKN